MSVGLSVQKNLQIQHDPYNQILGNENYSGTWLNFIGNLSTNPSQWLSQLNLNFVTTNQPNWTGITELWLNSDQNENA